MDKLAKWASGGSLAWLVVAVGLTLGTHGGSLHGAGTAGAAETDATETPAVVECPESPVATHVTVPFDGEART